MFIDKNGVVRKPVVYLADFEMFLPTCQETVAYWKKICDKYGFIGLFPGDGDPIEPGEDFWKRVFEHDVNHMYNSDMVIAQLDDWRGRQPDSGTLFEVGYFVALGMPAYGFYSSSNGLLDKNIEKELEDGTYYDLYGYAIEDREFVLDNMLSLIKVEKTFEDACKRARKDFDEILIQNGYEPFKVV